MVATTWDVPVEFEYATSRERRCVRSDPATGVVHRRSVWPQPNALRRFTLVWKNDVDAKVARLREIYKMAKGGADTITYTPVDGGSAVPVTIEGPLTIKRKGTLAFEASVVLVEERL